MKKNLSKFSILLCLLFLSIGYANAQSVHFSHNHSRYYQANSESTWRNFSSLSTSISGSDWLQSGNTSTYNGYLSNSWTNVIKRYNKGWWSGELFDWFTLTYYAPSYSSVTFNTFAELYVYHKQLKSSIRASYFDYGTNSSRWSGRGYDPSGYSDFRTCSGIFDSSTTQSTSTTQGEKAAIWTYKNSNTSASTTTSMSVTLDNSTGSSDTYTCRYGGFASSKSNSEGNSNYNHYTYLYMYYTYSITYYKYITFNANGGTGRMSQQTVANSANLTANEFTREGFTFAGWKDDKGNDYTDKQSVTANDNSKGPLTLYAQWKANDVYATFDYSCRNGVVENGTLKEVYVNLSEDDQSMAQGENPFTKYVRVNLRNASNSILKTVVLTAPAATAPAATITDDISTHKKAQIKIQIVKGSGTDVLSGANCTIYLDNTNYTNYCNIDYEVLKMDGSTKAPFWAPAKSGTTTYLKYSGFASDNMFDLTWRVNLRKLSMYPATIFAKPMRKDSHTTGAEYEQISPMAGLDGVVCALAGYIDADGHDVSIADYNNKTAEQKADFNQTGGAYYLGQYNVRKTCVHNNQYYYRLGLTGFHLDGRNYYLSETQGSVPSDMTSSEELQFVNATSDHHIDYDRYDKDIPVLILSPNGSNAVVNGESNYVLYVDNHATRTVNLAQFEATRPDYIFKGWYDTRSKNVLAADADYTFHLGTQATTTLAALWERITAPNIAPEEMDDTNNFVYKVKVEDDLNDIQSVRYIYTDDNTEPAADATGWADMTNAGNGIYTHTISLLNDHNGEYLWVKAANTDKCSITNMGQIRSIFRVKANPDPDSKVVESIENGTWTTPEGNEEPVFTHDGTYTTTNYYNYYSTFYFGDRTFIANNTSVFTAQINGNHLDLTEIKPAEEKAPVIIPAGTAVILRKNLATDGEIKLQEYNEPAPTLDGTNNLEGVDDQTDQTTLGDYQYYIFSYAQKGLGFYLNSSNQLAAHKAFIKLDKDSNNARAFTLNFSDSETTGITDIECTDVEDNTIYDLSGRQVNAANAKGGIYIKGGKKIMIK